MFLIRDICVIRRLELLRILIEVGGAEEDQAEAPQAGAVGGDALEVKAGDATERRPGWPKRLATTMNFFKRSFMDDSLDAVTSST